MYQNDSYKLISHFFFTTIRLNYDVYIDNNKNKPHFYFRLYDYLFFLELALYDYLGFFYIKYKKKKQISLCFTFFIFINFNIMLVPNSIYYIRYGVVVYEESNMNIL